MKIAISCPPWKGAGRLRVKVPPGNWVRSTRKRPKWPSDSQVLVTIESRWNRVLLRFWVLSLCNPNVFLANLDEVVVGIVVHAS